MPRVKDMQGRRFGMLTVGERASSPEPHAKWACVCDCGNHTVISGHNLRKKNGQHSCGCVSLGKRTHGMSTTRVYGIWASMIKRCTNPNVAGWKDYGGRGVTVCDPWRESFESFYADMGDPPSGHSIERRDNDKGYGPGNCYWLPRVKQSLNRRCNVYVEIDGETVTATEAARRSGVKYTTFLYRLRKASVSVGAAP